MLVHKNGSQVPLFRTRYNKRLMHRDVWNRPRVKSNMHCKVKVKAQEKVNKCLLHNITYRGQIQQGAAINLYKPKLTGAALSVLTECCQISAKTQLHPKTAKATPNHLLTNPQSCLLTPPKSSRDTSVLLRRRKKNDSVWW